MGTSLYNINCALLYPHCHVLVLTAGDVLMVIL